MHPASAALVTNPKVGIRLTMDSSSSKYSHLSIATVHDCNAGAKVQGCARIATGPGPQRDPVPTATCARIAHAQTCYRQSSITTRRSW